MKLKWTFLPAVEQFAKHTTSWDILNKKLMENHPFTSSNFVLPLVKHFGGNDLLLAILFEDSNPISMALIEKVRPFQWSTFLPSQIQIAPVLFGDYQHILSLIHNLPNSCLAFDLLCNDKKFSFSELNKSNPTITIIPHANTIDISSQKDFSDYWKSRPKNLRKNIKRYLNRLCSENIDYKLNICTNDISLHDALIRYGILESSGWKSKLGTAIHHNNKQGSFYRDMLGMFEKEHSASIYELYFDRQLSASRIVISNDNSHIILKTTFDESLKRYSPGRILLYLLINHLISADNTKTIEFYTNASKEQLDWSVDSRWITHATIYRNSYIKNLLTYSKSIKSAFGKITE